MFGPREIDSVGSRDEQLTVVSLAAVGRARAGSRRVLAERVTASNPDILALSEIDDGDALSLATQLGYQWAYRGGQALFWNARFAAARIEESYLPAPPLQAFERRGLLRVDGRCGKHELTLLTTRFASSRARARDLRLTRSVIREVRASRVLLFIANPPATGSAAFRDLGFEQAENNGSAALMVGVRGCAVRACSEDASAGGLGGQLVALITV